MVFTHLTPNIETALTFDDVSLIPSFSAIESRSECDVRTKLSRNYEMAIPIIAANMSSVCEEKMAIAMMELGGVGIVHRFCTIMEQCEMAKQVVAHANLLYSTNNSIWKTINTNIPICFAVGATGDYFERAQRLLEHGVNVILIDVAHAHHIHVKTALEKLQTLRSKYKFDIIVGNVVTYEAAKDLMIWGVDGIKVGIGGGSLCKTRIETGMGIPNLSAMNDVHDAVWESGVLIPIILDGGIRKSGDVAKSLVFGASSVMCGSIFAGSDETPGEEEPRIDLNTHGENTFTVTRLKKYYGSASKYQKEKSNIKTDHIEGEYTEVVCKGPVKNIIASLLDGVRSSMSYAGTRNLRDFAIMTEYIKVTAAGVIEGHPHLLLK